MNCSFKGTSHLKMFPKRLAFFSAGKIDQKENFKKSWVCWLVSLLN